MDKFKNKYRTASARAPFWDYGGFGAYFVTICTQNRICWVGHVVHEKMELSDIGEIAQSEWFKTFEMRPRHEFMDGRICGDAQSFTCHYRDWG